MSDSLANLNLDISDSSSLYNVLKKCVNFQSNESLYIENCNSYINTNNNTNTNTNINTNNSIFIINNYKKFDYLKMISMNSNSCYMSSSTSYPSDDSIGDGILEEEGRISLAYEGLHTIPRNIAEKFAAKTKFLDLSYNKFDNLSFLSFFEGLHTLILDRNPKLKHNSLPYMANLKILWINNCEIINIKDWIQRIQTQCPVLEHLSIMGNPGIKDQFEYCTLTHQSDVNFIVPKTVTANYREYILHVLPGLLYIDGITREKFLEIDQSMESVTSKSSTQSSSKESTNNNKNNNNNNNANNRKKSPTLSFKELFQLKRRKKSYQSSSTN